jgi:hypothetical protein
MRTNAGNATYKRWIFVKQRGCKRKTENTSNIRNIAGTKQTEETSKANNFIITPKFWSSNRGQLLLQ